MECREIEALASAAADQELSPEEKARLDLHTRSCPSCRRELRWSFSMKKALRGLPTPEMPEGLRRSLLSAAAKPAAPAASPPRYAVWGGAMALACAMAVLGIRFYRLEAPVEVPVDALLKAHGEYARGLVR